jgi:hypothetical protein
MVGVVQVSAGAGVGIHREAGRSVVASLLWEGYKGIGLRHGVMP